MVAPRRINRLRIKDDLTFASDNISMVFDDARNALVMDPSGYPHRDPEPEHGEGSCHAV